MGFFAKLFRRKPKYVDLSKKPDKLLDWANPEERAEAIIRMARKAASNVADKMFELFPPTLGVLTQKEEQEAMGYAIRPMFIHVAMEKMWSQWNPTHPFVREVAYKVSGKYAWDVHQRKTQVLNRMYPLLRTMDQDMALDMIEKLLERFDAKIKIYENTRTYERDPDKSTFHRMALHIASEFYKQADRPYARKTLIQVAVKEAGMLSRRM
jgi:hypothetical protein